MTQRSIKLLVAVAGLGAGLGAATAAEAGNAYGGGASYGAATMRVAMDCFGLNTAMIYGRTVPQVGGFPAPSVVSLPSFAFTGVPAFNCAVATVDPTARLGEVSTSSSNGLLAMYGHDPMALGDTSPAANSQFYPFVSYGLSTFPLDPSQYAIYVAGGAIGPLSFAAPGQPQGTNDYPNPLERYGPLVQVPAAIGPVVLAFDPVYKKVRNANGTVSEYRFRLNFPRANGSGGLRLNAAAYCGILNGVGPNGTGNRNWNSAFLQTLNGGVSLRDLTDPDPGFSVPMQIVGHLNFNGTTWMLSRHLNVACAGFPWNQFTTVQPGLPLGLVGPAYNKSLVNSAPAGETLTRFTIAEGADGVAKYVDFSRNPAAAPGSVLKQGRIGYLSPEQALPVSAAHGINGYGLMTATLRNAAGGWAEPSPNQVFAGFPITPPDSTANGAYNSDALDPRSRGNPTDWVDWRTAGSPLANPTAASAYPIIGTLNLLTYTCYAQQGTMLAVRGFMDWYYTSPIVYSVGPGLLTQYGLAPLPAAWRRAIHETFVSGAAPLGLRINVKPASALCMAVAPVGPGA